jgi:hypothetical protein
MTVISRSSALRWSLGQRDRRHVCLTFASGPAFCQGVATVTLIEEAGVVRTGVGRFDRGCVHVVLVEDQLFLLGWRSGQEREGVATDRECG